MSIINRDFAALQQKAKNINAVKVWAMNKKDLIPSGFSSLRIIALPLFFYFFSTGATAICLLIFALAQLTDLIDGYAARKLKVSSRFGAYFDAAADFALISGVFAAFTFSNYYPVWMLLLIVLSFAQFIASSLYSKKLYDPLGKYIGGILYIAITLTLLSPTPAIFMIVDIVFPLFAITSFVSRLISFNSSHKRALIIEKKRPDIWKKFHS
jgi:CDP-diacylglycerol--glycerol-3-phosphate 3-phosphatidyltransferase